MVGIFTYSTHFKDKFRTFTTLGEGNTPLLLADKLAAKYGMEAIFFKDETVNPSGSFKDRATAYQITYWTQIGSKHFVLSSSGNAAISAALYAKKFNLTLDLFLSSKTTPYKLVRLKDIIEDADVSIHFSRTPKKEALAFAKESSAINLLASRDDNALEGYKTLGLELLEQKTDGIFMPTSSGAGILGIALGNECLTPLYAIQTTKINTIAKQF